jgi:hypothetical protein
MNNLCIDCLWSDYNDDTPIECANPKSPFYGQEVDADHSCRAFEPCEPEEDGDDPDEYHFGPSDDELEQRVRY